MAVVAKFGLAIQYDKVNSGSLFGKNIYIGLRCVMLHTKFYKNHCVPGKKIFKVFTIYGHDSHLGHVNSITCMVMNFHFPVQAFILKWLKMAQRLLGIASLTFLCK